MNKAIAVVAETGMGKSSSLRNLDPSTTFICKSIKKGLPWRGSNKKYTFSEGNSNVVTNFKSLMQTINHVNTNMKHIKTLVLDDVGYQMTYEFFRRALENGYGKFAEIGKQMADVISTAIQGTRDDLRIIFMFHQDTDTKDFVQTKKIRSLGRMLEDKFDPASMFDIVFYADVTTEKGKNVYSFITNRHEGYPAKSPMGMFEDIRIPNDMKSIIETVDEYYD